MTSPRVVPVKQSEADFQRAVIDLAHLYRWRVAHFRPAMMRSGRWATPVQGDGAGFPDLILVRARRLLALELKSDKGRATPAQIEWLADLAHAGVEAHVIRPGDWDQLVELLK